jgi:flavodoxin
MKACVIYDTRYGNTEKIARSIENGLKGTGIETSCVNVRDVEPSSLKQYDLICVGGPTQHQTASETMQDFLRSLEKAKLSGKLGFAFDTRRDSFLAGSSAKFIEDRLQKFGLKMAGERVSAIIIDPEPEEKRRESESKDEWKERRHGRERLQDGEEKRFEQVGTQIGAALVASGPLAKQS